MTPTPHHLSFADPYSWHTHEEWAWLDMVNEEIDQRLMATLIARTATVMHRHKIIDDETLAYLGKYGEYEH